jgi:heme/copper-type cytochrome/quinol oxidase subunit 4
MKRIYKLGKGYVHMDTYVSGETRRWSLAIALFTVIITVITATALVGVDVTQINPQPIQEQTNEAR